jgi:hypothetical protein
MSIESPSAPPAAPARFTGAGGLFMYTDPERPGSGWRPDLAPAILAWLTSLTAEDLATLQGLGVTPRGGLVAHFDGESWDTDSAEILELNTLAHLERARIAPVDG